MVIKWMNENLSWFFTNGNKANAMHHDHRPGYTIEDDGEFVNIKMKKHVFIHVAKFGKYGLECYRYESLPRWEPKLSSARTVVKTVDAMNFDAFRIGQEICTK